MLSMWKISLGFGGIKEGAPLLNEEEGGQL